ncbi:MAG TPA: hypothetical protein VF091_01555 [Gaiellaceae bacterium]
MGDETTEARVGRNESIFREINERAEEIGAALERPTEFLCECYRTDCTERLSVPGDVYERVRARSRYFLVLPGHERHEFERVVDQGNGWLVVTKIGVAGEVAEEEDPRTG